MVCVVLLALTIFLGCAQGDTEGRQQTVRRQWTNRFAVHVLGGEEVAQQLARKHGYSYLGEIMQDYYLFASGRVVKRSTRPAARYLRSNLAGEPMVLWYEQQQARRRVKREISHRHSVSGRQHSPNDPRWAQMWYLNRGSGLDMNVEKVWAQGVTGKGVVVSILDDGIEYTNSDLARNYDRRASFDVNDGDVDPQPRYDPANNNNHGTRAAGIVAAQGNNSVCISGIAFNARIGGVRMLDGDVTDSVEARALSFNRDHIHIYSAGWGPDDDGKTVDGPGRLTQLALKLGVEQGRNGKGSIFVWASGNGGRDSDNCNCDGYSTSIYTLSISSATEDGAVPWYSEACSSKIATTYSSGSAGDRKVVTTDIHNGCTDEFTGTSASVPMASAIFALALEANSNLTWRDLQHLVVRSSRPTNLVAPDWTLNGVGRNVSHHFGFGLIDAALLVRFARNWTTVPKHRRCTLSYPHRRISIPPRTKKQFVLKTEGCKNDPDNRVLVLEHVQSWITLTTPARRGDVKLVLTSPSGTKSTLLEKRPRDLSREGFRDWTFMTTHSWGERAAGEWVLEVDNGELPLISGQTAQLMRWDLVMYGTDSPIGTFGGSA